MATVVEFTTPGDTFPLGRAFQRFPDVTVELERVVPTSRAVVPYVWVIGADDAEVSRIEDSFRDHPDLRSVELIDEVGGRYLLRVEWSKGYRGMLKAFAATDTNLISGKGSGDRWTFEIRSDDREGVSEFQRYCREQGIGIELTSVRTLSTLGTGSEHGLTEPQREALVLAFERGYFDSPRRSTLEEIAGELDITRQSVASRLRRGNRRLIGNTLIDR